MNKGGGKGKRTNLHVPLLVVQPGLLTAPIILGAVAIDVLNRFGVIQALLVESAAFALPILSYVTRTANPRQVLIDTSSLGITLTYARFGKTWQRTYDLEQFRGVYWAISIGRFPKIELNLKGPDNRVKLFWLDFPAAGKGDREGVPEVMRTITALLVQAGLEDMTYHKGNAR